MRDGLVLSVAAGMKAFLLSGESLGFILRSVVFHAGIEMRYVPHEQFT